MMKVLKIVIENGKNGYLFQNQEEYIQKVNELLENETLFKRMQKEARKSAENHSSKKFAERALEVYQKAIEENGENKEGLVGTIEGVIKRGFYGK